MDVTADRFVTQMMDKVIKKREPEHVKFYSTRDYRLFFTGANLQHVATKLITPPLKVHIGEKHG
jgi:hypothetical protein